MAKKEIEKEPEVKSYTPKKEVLDFIIDCYTKFQEDKTLKDDIYREIGNQTLAKFWQKSRDNYDIVVPARSRGDWKRSVKTTMTRDKANGFISRLARQMIYPQIIAQNKDQEIDNVVSRVLRILHEWWDGLTKSFRVFTDMVHTAVVDGTAHLQVDVINGKEVRTIAKNEEIFIPNFYQFDLQKQSHIIRVQTTSYDEAKLIFGEKENWQYVMKGSVGNWAINDDFFKKKYNHGLLADNEVQIMYVWEHGGYDNENNPKPKKYNALINGVPMEDIDNELVYKHNLYNLVKVVFEKTSDVDFYWGNSLPNKIRQNQEFKDAFRTILLNKAVLNLLPPVFNRSGEYVDADTIAPSSVIPLEAGTKDDFFTPEGFVKPITASDLNVEALVDREANEATAAPQSLGQAGESGKTTLGEIQLRDARAMELMEIFGNMMAFGVEDLAEQSLPNILQFAIKKDVKRLVDGAELLEKKQIQVPQQNLSDGSQGTVGVNFVPKEQIPGPYEILRQETDLETKTGTKHELFYLDPSYIQDLKFFIKVIANPVSKNSEAMERMLALDNYNQVYKGNPYINQKEAVKTLIRLNKDDEEKLMETTQQNMAMPPEEQQNPNLTPVSTRLKSSRTFKARNIMPVA
jgi:hypothetical protein